MNAADHDRYSIVAYASPEVRASVAELRRLAPPSGRPVMDAHVTVKGTFIRPIDLDKIIERIRLCCARANPFTLTTSERRVWHEPGKPATIALDSSAPEALVSLHHDLVRELRGLATTDYSGEGAGIFEPHLTLVQDIPGDEVSAALAVFDRFSPQYTFDVREVALVGRRAGKVWETLATFPIGQS